MIMGSAMCGGVVPESKFLKDPMAFMMCFVMKDKYYKKYIKLLKDGKKKEASKIFNKYVWSVI